MDLDEAQKALDNARQADIDDPESDIIGSCSDPYQVGCWNPVLESDYSIDGACEPCSTPDNAQVVRSYGKEGTKTTIHVNGKLIHESES